MAPLSKGKEKVADGYGTKSAAKRKCNNAGDEAIRKRNRSVLQFFEETADIGDDDSSDESMFGVGDDFLEDEFGYGNGSGSGSKVATEPAKAPNLHFVPKEEQITEEEFDKILEERYKPGSSFVTYAEDNYESKRSIETSTYLPSTKEPVIWKVKCMVGRERHSAFCLMQKYVDLKDLGTKLQIISVFSLDHVKGFIYIEAEKQSDIYEACNGLCSIYSSRITPVPKDEISHLFSVRSKGNGISEGMWARVKSGTYKGDLAQVVAVNDTRKKVTVKLIPRIDLQAMAEKFGRGITPQKNITPAPRLISSSELEEFRPLIQYRRDRDTNKIFEILDGMMLKDGYLYKKVSMDSLNFWGVKPTEDELLKFEPSKSEESNDLEFLSQLYGERKKRRHVVSDKGSRKGEGSSSFSLENKFEVHDLVFVGRKDFGVIIGSEKDDSFKIIKEGPEGPVTANVQARELKNAEFDKKLFTALDQQLKNISVNDTVMVMDGPLKDKQGVVKKIYRGIVFLYNETEEANNGYICAKARFCEKVEPASGACTEKSGEPGSSSFGDFSSSPKSPLSPEQSQQEKGASFKFNRDDNAMFSIGQSLRIRVGPLKGYLCRVLAVRRSDVTVKLDSQHKILTVKCEHLSEVRGKSSGFPTGLDADSVKSFDLLGVQDGSGGTATEVGGWNSGGTATESGGWNSGGGTATEGGGWSSGGGTATDGGGWNSGALSTERNSWPPFPASNSSVQQGSASSLPPKSVDEDANKGDSSWEVKGTPGLGSSWGAAGAADKTAAGTDSFGDGASDSWAKAVESRHQTTGVGLKDDSWSQAAGNLGSKGESKGNESSWNGLGVSPEKQNVGWRNAVEISNQPEGTAWNKSQTVNEVQASGWGSKKKDEGRRGGCSDVASTWNNPVEKEEKGSSGGQGGVWNKTAEVTRGDSPWNKQESSWSKQSGESSWSKQNVGGGGSSRSKPAGGSSGSKPDGGSTSWSKPDGGSSSWSKSDGGSSSWSKPDGGSSSWSKQGGGSSWHKGDGGASWNSPTGTGKKDETNQRGSWGRTKAFDGDRDTGGRGRDSKWGSAGTSTGFSCGEGNVDNRSSDLSKGNFNASRTSDGTWSSGWNKGSVANERKGEEDQACGWGKGSGSSGEEKSGWDNKSGNWQNSKSTLDNKLESWNKRSATNDESKAIDGAGDWEKKETPVEVRKSSWESSTISLDKNKSSAWGSQSNWGTSKASDSGNAGGEWNSKKSSEEGSSSGWGQSKWGVAADTGGNQGYWGSGGNQGSWGRKRNWSSEDNLGGSEEQADTFGEKGRGGGWRGGRGERWGSDGGRFGGRGGSGHGGFRGRGGSDSGGFRGRGRSDRGGFGDRGRSDGGGFRDRGRSDSGRFCGRGGFGSRGRGRRDDWNNKNDSGEDKPYSWNISNKETSWSSGGGGVNWSGSSGWKSDGAAGGGYSAQAGSWTNDGASDGKARSPNGEGGNWKTSNSSGGTTSAWNQAPTSCGDKAVGTWGQPGKESRKGWSQPSSDGVKRDSWGQQSNESSKGSSWDQPIGGSGKSSSWGQHSNEGRKCSSWGQPSGGGNWSGSSGWKSEGAAGGGDRAEAGGWTDDGGSDSKASSPDGKGGNWKTSNSSGVNASSAWNQAPAREVADRVASSSWGQPNDESGKNNSWGQPSGSSVKGGLVQQSNESSNGSSWDQPSGGSGKSSSWGQPSNENRKGSSWGQPSGGGGSWGKPSNGSSKDSSWHQPAGGSGKSSPFSQPSDESSQRSGWGQPSSGSESGKGSSWDQPSEGSGKGDC